MDTQFGRLQDSTRDSTSRDKDARGNVYARRALQNVKMEFQEKNDIQDSGVLLLMKIGMPVSPPNNTEF